MHNSMLASVALLATVGPATAQTCSSCLIGECASVGELASVCLVEPTTLYLGGMFVLDPRDLTGGQVKN